MPLSGRDTKGTVRTSFLVKNKGAIRVLFCGWLSSVSFPALAAVTDFSTPAMVISLSAVAATFLFSIVISSYFFKARQRAMKERDELAKKLAEIRAKSDRIESLVHCDDQRLVFWSSKKAKPSVLGQLPETCGAPEDPDQFIVFDNWLEPPSAQALEKMMASLRDNGTAFQLAVRSHTGSYVDTFGRTISGRVFVRFRDLSGDRQVQLELQQHFARKSADLNSFKALFEAIDQPVWQRNDKGENGRPITWANKAYRLAVDGSDNDENLVELLDQNARDNETDAHKNGARFSDRVNAVAAGNRRTFDIVSVPTQNGSVGIATDVSEAEKARLALTRTIATHEKTFNELATAVAIFDKSRKLTFYNNAYRELFGLEETFLRSAPNDSEIIDKLRALGKLPVEANFREWKRDLLNTHQSVEMKEFNWHLPDGQTLRVIASPRNAGGMTWIYENMTAQINLESRVNVLSRIQGETLNRLSDGVAVFSSNGRLTLSNASFGEQWGFDDNELQALPHVNDVVEACVRRFENEEAWHTLKMAIVGVMDRRTEVHGTMERPDHKVIQYATSSLIDGRTMVTFVDITDSVNFERALTEKNEALEQADNLKSEFVQHVSYELRSPLTNIIGFAQLLSDDDVGPLTEKQQEYIDYIFSSSSSLLAIINDILDLATADAGVLELSLVEIYVEDTVQHAVGGLQDRLMERNIDLVVDTQEEIGTFIGDDQRITQILFNLLSNAIRFSDDYGKVLLKVERKRADIIFTVQDWGAGIPEAFIKNVFQRFESRGSGIARGGVGLGLSIVKRLVELHQGKITIDSEEGVGTTVVCAIPAEPKTQDIAAE